MRDTTTGVASTDIAPEKASLKSYIAITLIFVSIIATIGWSAFLGWIAVRVLFLSLG